MALDYLFIMCLLHAYVHIYYIGYFILLLVPEFPLTNPSNMPKNDAEITSPHPPPRNSLCVPLTFEFFISCRICSHIRPSLYVRSLPPLPLSLSVQHANRSSDR